MGEIVRRWSDSRASEEPRSHQVVSLRNLSESVFVLRLRRQGLGFLPGQWINVGTIRGGHQREYTIYSSPGDDYLEVLVKEVGAVSRALHELAPGDFVRVEGPHGGFHIREQDRPSGKFLFLATGTGISPFHCFVRSHPGLDYLLLHGTRTAGERIDPHCFEASRLIQCVSRGEGGDFPGRVTDYLRTGIDPTGRQCYLCGNSDMIYEAFAILNSAGVPRARIHTEVYF